MNNFLEGIQFANLKNTLPSWQGAQYDPWQDVTNPHIVYNSGTKFRVKPETIYWVGPNKYKTEEAAMDRIRSVINTNEGITIRKEVKTPDFHVFLAGKSIEYKLLGTATWTPIVDFRHDPGYNGTVKFRLRPDFIYKVHTTTPDGLGFGEVEFDDVEDLKRHIDLKVSTSNFDSLRVFRVKNGR